MRLGYPHSHYVTHAVRNSVVNTIDHLGVRGTPAPKETALSRPGTLTPLWQAGSVLALTALLLFVVVSLVLVVRAR